jgi:hypothetical protein
MTRLGLVIAATVMIAATVSAHHSPAAFDMSAQITIQGTISRLDWTNPHVYIHVKGQTASGTPAEWMFETDPVPILTRSGWRRELLAVGAPVTVRAHPDRNSQRNHALLVSIGLRNGVVLTPRSAATPSGAKASSVAGVWNALRGFPQRQIGAVKPTAKGLAAMKAFTEPSNPVVNCVPYVTPWLPALPYLNEIEVGKDRVVIRSEFLNVDRTVYMDGRPHPTGATRTIHGHSIGRWEGDVLVVDTTLFADHLLGNLVVSPGVMAELPSGPRKHVVERYQLNGDRTRLLVSAVVEDPDYLAEPLTLSTTWDFAPGQRLLRFGCDREQSRRYLFR